MNTFKNDRVSTELPKPSLITKDNNLPEKKIIASRDVPEVKKSSNPQFSNEFSPMQNKFINEALKTHNECRGRHNCPPLDHNKEISKIAQAYANKLAKLKNLQHSTKDARAYNNQTLGENLSFSYDSELDYYPGK